MNADQLQATLLAGIPSIFIGVERGALYINPMTLAEDEVGIVLNRLQDIGKTARSYSPDVL
jgi:hypothetical protein